MSTKTKTIIAIASVIFLIIVAIIFSPKQNNTEPQEGTVEQQY